MPDRFLIQLDTPTRLVWNLRIAVFYHRLLVQDIPTRIVDGSPVLEDQELGVGVAKWMLTIVASGLIGL